MRLSRRRRRVAHVYGEKHKMKTSRAVGGLRAEAVAAATRLFSLLHGRRRYEVGGVSRIATGWKKSALQHTPR